MTGVLRHLFAVVVLPFTMAIVIPIWLARRSDIRLATGRGVLELGSQVIGLILLFSSGSCSSWRVCAAS
jgi:hypothetical protein